MFKSLLASLLLTAFVAPSCAQFASPAPPRISADEALDRFLLKNSLTYQGKPFHAVLDIQAKDGNPEYTGSVEVFWLSPTMYRLISKSPKFSQLLIVNGEQVQEQNTGDFYPNWLLSFRKAILTPIPREQDLRGRPGPVAWGSEICLNRNDKVHGITDDLMRIMVCSSSTSPDLSLVIDFSYNMEFHDYASFKGKRIARTYISDEGDRTRLLGKLTTLEEWKSPDMSLLTITSPTPKQDRILTTLVSTLTEESMLEHKSEHIEWPQPHEGPLSGFLIVNAVTDRTGQVRETSKYNSDNAEMESAARLIALQYKFHPLVLDGVAQQMQMPLVLHFESPALKPYFVMHDAETRANVQGCKLPQTMSIPELSGKHVTVDLLLVEDGRISQVGVVGYKIFPPMLYEQVRSCSFAPHLEDGKPARFHAQFDVVAK